jgi:hypothetical protein
MSIDKRLPHVKFFPTIFYFRFLEHRKVPFGALKVCRILNPFEIFLIRFESV